MNGITKTTDDEMFVRFMHRTTGKGDVSEAARLLKGTVETYLQRLGSDEREGFLEYVAASVRMLNRRSDCWARTGSR